MSGTFMSYQAYGIDRFCGNISSWWATASAQDFGLMAGCVVVSVWFLTKYYSD